MLLGQLVSALLVSGVVGDLVCKDFIPHNWTTPLARIRGDGDAPPTAFLPANVTASIPLQIGSKKDPGDIFHLRVCNSSSLFFQSSYELGCDVPTRRRDSRLNIRQQGDGCSAWYQDYFQVIHPSIGHCLSARDFGANNTKFTWKACDLDPQNTAQIFYGSRFVYYHEKPDNTPGRAYDWAPYIYFGATPIPAWAEGFLYTYLDPKDNKTIGYVANTPPDQFFRLTALHHDPLTNYQKGKD